ncbi:MAG: SGNH/GDSL hydrolase family protein [Verrucomicrobiales bacterium]
MITPSLPTIVRCLLLLAVVTPAATAAQFSGLYVFGDSLSDVGNTSLATGGALPGPAYYNGRYSNGPVWVESLAASLSLPLLTPSLLGGTNHAWAGAFTQSGGAVPTISQQAAQFAATGGVFEPTDLVVLWGGANDFLLSGQTNPAVPVANLGGIVSTLAGAGAQTILLPNLPDLADTPELRRTNNPALMAGVSLLINAFNAALATQIPLWENTHGVDIVPLDIYGIGKELSANPSAYGFTNTTDSALLSGAADDADAYLYWDTVHPTTRVHEVFAHEARRRTVPESSPTFWLLLPALAAFTVHRRLAGRE